MPRVLAVLALLLLPVLASAQDTEDDTDTDTDSGAVVVGGAVEVSGESGGRPSCGCDGLAGGPTLSGLLLAALVARRRR